MNRSMATPVLMVHGGAWSIPKDEFAAHREGCRQAALRGYAVLERGGSALDAVVEAVAAMEEDLTFNAGRGAHIGSGGEVELDAGAMRGDLAVGAVAAAVGVRSPVRLARAMIEARCEAVLIVGAAARAEAERLGVPVCDSTFHATDRERERFHLWRQCPDWKLGAAFDPSAAVRFPNASSDTVGAVARDARGALAAATSTGGAPFKPAGRVGDSPIPGAGFYACDGLGAASTTGHGESILKMALALRAVEALERMEAQAAAARAIDDMQRRVGGHGGVILLGPTGDPAYAFNTAHMAVACVHSAGSWARCGEENVSTPRN